MNNQNKQIINADLTKEIQFNPMKNYQPPTFEAIQQFVHQETAASMYMYNVNFIQRFYRYRIIRMHWQGYIKFKKYINNKIYLSLYYKIWRHKVKKITQRRDRLVQIYYQRWHFNWTYTHNLQVNERIIKVRRLRLLFHMLRKIMFNLRIMNLNAETYYRGIEHKRKKMSFCLLHSSYIWQKNYRIFYLKDEKMTIFDEDMFKNLIQRDIQYYQQYYIELADYFLSIINYYKALMDQEIFKRPVFMYLLQSFQEVRKRRRARQMRLKQNQAFLDCFWRWKDHSINRRFIIFHYWVRFRNMIYIKKRQDEELKYSIKTEQLFQMRKYFKQWLTYKNTLVLRDNLDSELVKLSLPLKFLMNAFNDISNGVTIVEGDKYYRQDQVVRIDGELIYKEEAQNLQLNQNMVLQEDREFQLKFKFLTRIRSLHSKTQSFYRLFLICIMYLNYTRYKLAFKLLQKRNTTYNDYLKAQGPQQTTVTFSSEKQIFLNKDVIDFLFTISSSGKNQALQESLLRKQPPFIQKFVYIILSLSISDLLIYFDDMLAQTSIKQEILFFFNVMLNGKFTYEFNTKKQVLDPDQTFISRIQKYRFLMSKFPQKTLTFLKNIEPRLPYFSRFDFNSPLPKTFNVCRGKENYYNFQHRFDGQLRTGQVRFLTPFINNLVVPYSQFLLQSFVISDVQLQKGALFNKHKPQKHKIGLIYQDPDVFDYTELTQAENLVAERWFKLHNITDTQTQNFILQKFKQYKKMYGDKAVTQLQNSIKTIIQYSQSQDSKLNSKFKKLEGIKVEKEDNYLNDIIYDTIDLGQKNQEKLIALQEKQIDIKYTNELKQIKDRRRQKQEINLLRQMKIQPKLNVNRNKQLVKDIDSNKLQNKTIKIRKSIVIEPKEENDLTSEEVRGSMQHQSSKNNIHQNLLSKNTSIASSLGQLRKRKNRTKLSSEQDMITDETSSYGSYSESDLSDQQLSQKKAKQKLKQGNNQRHVKGKQQLKQLKGKTDSPIHVKKKKEHLKSKLQTTYTKKEQFINTETNTKKEFYGMFNETNISDIPIKLSNQSVSSKYNDHKLVKIISHNSSRDYDQNLDISSDVQKDILKYNKNRVTNTPQDKIARDSVIFSESDNVDQVQQKIGKKETQTNINSLMQSKQKIMPLDRPKSQLVYSKRQLKQEIQKQENQHLLKILQKSKDLRQYAKKLLENVDTSLFSKEILKIVNKFIGNPLKFVENWQSSHLPSLDKAFIYFLFSDIDTSLLIKEVSSISDQDKDNLLNIFSFKFRKSLYEILTLQIIGKEFSKNNLLQEGSQYQQPKVKLAFDDMVLQNQQAFPIIVKTNDFFNSYYKTVINSEILNKIENKTFIYTRNGVKKVFQNVLQDPQWQPFIISYIEFRPTRQIPKRFIAQQILKINKQEKLSLAQVGEQFNDAKIYNPISNILPVQKLIPALPFKKLMTKPLAPLFKTVKRDDIMGMRVITYEKAYSQRPSISIEDWIVETNLDDLENFKVQTD